jgi:RES domain
MSCGLPIPGPNENFNVRQLTHEDVRAWYHVYSTRFHKNTTPDTFSQGWGDTRFAPIFQHDGKPVHTYYAASTREATYMESILHDIALNPPGMFEVKSLDHFHIVRLELASPFNYVSFHSNFLPQLNLTKTQLIESLPACYPETRAWAQAAYNQCPDAQGIGYTSKKGDEGRCIMLFKQRLPTPPFTVTHVATLNQNPFRAEVLDLVRALKLHEV